MALLHSFEKSGNWLFKQRGVMPVFVFLACTPIFLWTYPIDFIVYSMPLVLKLFIVLVAVSVSVLGMAIRAYTIGTTPHGTSGRNTDKQLAKQLNTKGIYSVVRHPLYVGNYLMWLGLLIFIMDFPFLLATSLMFWLYYERIMYAEERYLEGEFGQQYLDWSMQVPAFIPKFRQFQKGDVPFHFRSVLRREYPGLMAITLCFTVVDYLRTALFYGLHSFVDWIRPSGIICLHVAVLVIVLRYLKHHSSLLASEPNRD